MSDEGLKNSLRKFTFTTNETRKGDSVVNDLRIRYEVGNAEHKDSWEDWRKNRFLREAHEELLDLVLYRAMMRVVHGG